MAGTEMNGQASKDDPQVDIGEEDVSLVEEIDTFGSGCLPEEQGQGGGQAGRQGWQVRWGKLWWKKTHLPIL